MRPIAAGEEMTVAYGDISARAADRQAHLRTAYGFACACTACTNTIASDRGRDLALNAPLPRTSHGFAFAEEMLAQYERMGLQAHERYLLFLERVAGIQRRAGNTERADELTVLALRVSAAFKGREHAASGMAARLLSGVDLNKENGISGQPSGSSGK